MKLVTILLAVCSCTTARILRQEALLQADDSPSQDELTEAQAVRVEEVSLTPHQIDDIANSRETIERYEKNPTLVKQNQFSTIVPLTQDQQAKILREYPYFFKAQTRSDGDISFRQSASNTGAEIPQENGIRVCPVSTDWQAITLAITPENQLVQVVQLPDVMYEQLVFEETCTTTTCNGVANSVCAAVPRYVRAVVIDLVTNGITITDITVHCCACHTRFP
ncbi:uncharacterized protein LOC144446535 [Glandiceps talaboti]